MARLVIRNLDADLEADLRERAERHGRSLEDEIRDILCDAVKDEELPTKGFGARSAKPIQGDWSAKGRGNS
jgi:plasmid stability protein